MEMGLAVLLVDLLSLEITKAGSVPVAGEHTHRCRKFFSFWEREETFRKFLPKVGLSGLSRSKKRVNMAENILNMKKILASSGNLYSLYLKYINNI